MNHRQCLALCVVTLFAAGCANKESKVVGKWTGSITLSDAQKKNPMMQQAVSAAGAIPLELKADHTFILAKAPGAVEGTWALTNDSLNLTKVKMGGKTIAEIKQKIDPKVLAQLEKTGNGLDKPMVVKLSTDATSMTMETGQPGISVTFKKA